jgi:Fic family protein
LQTLLKSLQEAEVGLQYIKDKTSFWNKHRDKELNPRQVKSIKQNSWFRFKNFEGGLTKKKYLAITKDSTTTVNNDLKQLLKLGWIKRTSRTIGRGTSYFVWIDF